MQIIPEVGASVPSRGRSIASRIKMAAAVLSILLVFGSAFLYFRSSRPSEQSSNINNYSEWSPSVSEHAPTISQPPTSPQFEDYSVSDQDIYKGTPAAVDLTSNLQAEMYRTQLMKHVPSGPNFAGHYTVAELSCGTSCQMYMIVDAVDGKVYDGVATYRGLKAMLNSTLLIADPPFPDEMSDNPFATIPVRYYMWHDNALDLIYEESCVRKDHKVVCGGSWPETITPKPQ